MTTQDIEVPAGATSASARVASAPAETRQEGRAIFHPVVDFLFLGGASLFILPLMYYSPETARPALLGLALILADFINQPHFAHSYQIFYRGYRGKLAGENLNRSMQIRYVIAGIVVPIALITFFIVAYLQPTATMLGYGANLMLFLSGWHYAKQGYGMLIVDSVFKRKFFDNREKDLLRYNTYACWLLYWLFANDFVAERDYWGLAYYTIDVPDGLLYIAMAAAAVTTVISLMVFARKFIANRESLPWTGVTAYLVTLYVWFLGRFHPAVFIFIPAFHSLQYLLIVWRFEINRTARQTKSPASRIWRLAKFGFFGLALSYLGFVLVPAFLSGQIAYDRETFGPFLFLFMFSLFINVHHYMIDNVIWRGENPEMRDVLFGPRPG